MFGLLAGVALGGCAAVLGVEDLQPGRVTALEDGGARDAPVPPGPDAGVTCRTEALCVPRVLAERVGVRSLGVGERSASWLLGTKAEGIALDAPDASPVSVAQPFLETSVVTFEAVVRVGRTSFVTGAFAGDQAWIGSQEGIDGPWKSSASFGPRLVAQTVVGLPGFHVVALVGGGTTRLRRCAVPTLNGCGDVNTGWADIGASALLGLRLAASDATLLLMGTTRVGVGALDACVPERCTETTTRVLDAIPEPTAVAGNAGKAFVGSARGTVTAVRISDRATTELLALDAPVVQLAVTRSTLYVLDTVGWLSACTLPVSGPCTGADRYLLTTEPVDAFAADALDVVAQTRSGRIVRLPP